MEDYANQHESNQQEWVEHRVGCHNEALLHRDERGSLYRVCPLLNYPLDSHTRPDLITLHLSGYRG